MATKPALSEPLIFIPAHDKPQLLFVLLHGEEADPEQLLPLADAIKQAFPLSMVVLPRGLHDVGRQLPDLIQQVQQLQRSYGLSGQQTALAGFSQGASMALEASHAQPGLAGRVLAFSGLYVTPPTEVPSATLLHFFHGANDQQVSLNEVESTLSRLAELQGDATLDVASQIGHELHDALIRQAIVRLQTCVPLRSWEEAMGSLQQQADQKAQPTSDPARILH
ncbi:alpha/beta hydrolase-fold protein [Pollutimonas harenae]|uniref:Esterase n=1 Tax=Pollutimonas harenae TaxID=657015 RepID=A0A853GUJ2_9BURK|nr:alpha/beta hydrolase-fold protein [Pollutimonas harenae]NYT85941.1 esterase [Pollutimonas harenae]TEA70991.1 esterase [Pollutimonas harenae]